MNLLFPDFIYSHSPKESRSPFVLLHHSLAVSLGSAHEAVLHASFAFPPSHVAAPLGQYIVPRSERRPNSSPLHLDVLVPRIKNLRSHRSPVSPLGVRMQQKCSSSQPSVSLFPRHVDCLSKKPPESLQETILHFLTSILRKSIPCRTSRIHPKKHQTDPNVPPITSRVWLSHP